jgi:hypothetical protein
MEQRKSCPILYRFLGYRRGIDGKLIRDPTNWQMTKDGGLIEIKLGHIWKNFKWTSLAMEAILAVMFEFLLNKDKVERTPFMYNSGFSLNAARCGHRYCFFSAERLKSILKVLDTCIDCDGNFDYVKLGLRDLKTQKMVERFVKHHSMRLSDLYTSNVNNDEMIDAASDDKVLSFLIKKNFKWPLFLQTKFERDQKKKREWQRLCYEAERNELASLRERKVIVEASGGALEPHDESRLELLETRRTTRINRRRSERNELESLRQRKVDAEKSGGALEPHDESRLELLETRRTTRIIGSGSIVLPNAKSLTNLRSLKLVSKRVVGHSSQMMQQD